MIEGDRVVASPPRVRLPGVGAPADGLSLPPASLATLAELGVGDALVGVAEDGAESPFEVVGVGAEDRPALTDAVVLDPTTGGLRITIGTGAYVPTSGAYARTLTVTARAVPA